MVSFLGIADARLAETLAQIEERYGNPIETPSKPDGARSFTRSYQAGGLKIGVTFLDGKSQSEMYWKADEKAKLNDIEISAILEKNCFDNVWKEDVSIVSKEPFKQKWILGGGAAFAVYMSIETPPVLWLMTRQYYEYNNEEQKNKQLKALDAL